MSTTERLELRIDSELLQQLDQWRSEQDDPPTRSEAIRSFIEEGVYDSTTRRSVRLSDGEKLITYMLSEISSKLEAGNEYENSLIRDSISGGHYWGLAWEFQNIFHSHTDKPSEVDFVVDVLDMWTFMEDGYQRLSDADKAEFAERAKPYTDVKFPGFDGNNESTHLSIARYLIKKMGRFSNFSDRKDLNSHFETLRKYQTMLILFQPMRRQLTSTRSLNREQLLSLILV